MCSLLNTLALMESESKEEFMEYLDGRDNIINFVIGELCFLGMFGFLIYAFWVIHSNFGILHHKKVYDKHYILYEGIRTDEYHRAMYNIYFMLRRLITVAILIFLQQPFF